MDPRERNTLVDKLWRVLELLQRVNMLCDIDHEQFKENNARCKRIKEVIQGLNDDCEGALYQAKTLEAEYMGIFSDEDSAEL